MEPTDLHQEREWESLYTRLQQLLSQFGEEDAFGDADYWIVSDNYGSRQQKVCVTRLPFLSEGVAHSVQKLLAQQFSEWEVIFALEDPSLTSTPDDLGVTVRATQIEESWSRVRMANAYPGQFRWNANAA